MPSPELRFEAANAPSRFQGRNSTDRIVSVVPGDLTWRTGRSGQPPRNTRPFVFQRVPTHEQSEMATRGNRRFDMRAAGAPAEALAAARICPCLRRSGSPSPARRNNGQRSSRKIEEAAERTGTTVRRCEVSLTRGNAASPSFASIDAWLVSRAPRVRADATIQGQSQISHGFMTRFVVCSASSAFRSILNQKWRPRGFVALPIMPVGSSLCQLGHSRRSSLSNHE